MYMRPGLQNSCTAHRLLLPADGVHEDRVPLLQHTPRGGLRREVPADGGALHVRLVLRDGRLQQTFIVSEWISVVNTLLRQMQPIEAVLILSDRLNSEYAMKLHQDSQRFRLLEDVKGQNNEEHACSASVSFCSWRPQSENMRPAPSVGKPGCGPKASSCRQACHAHVRFTSSLT